MYPRRILRVNGHSICQLRARFTFSVVYSGCSTFSQNFSNKLTVIQFQRVSAEPIWEQSRFDFCYSSRRCILLLLLLIPHPAILYISYFWDSLPSSFFSLISFLFISFFYVSALICYLYTLFIEQLPPLKNMEDATDYDIEKDIPTIEELEKLGEFTTPALRGLTRPCRPEEYL